MKNIVEIKTISSERYTLILRALQDSTIRDYFQFHEVIKTRSESFSVYHAETDEGSATLILFNGDYNYQQKIAGKPKAREIINEKLEEIVKKSIKSLIE